MTSETRKPEHVPQPQPNQKQKQPQKHVVHAEVHASMESNEPEVPIESQMSDEASDQGGHPPTSCLKPAS